MLLVSHNPQCISFPGFALLSELDEDPTPILRRRDDLKRTPLHCGCATGIPVDSAREMLIRDVSLLTMKDGNGLLPVQIAIQNEPVEGLIFELLRPNTSLVQVKTRQGESLLDLAAKSDAPKHAIYELLEIDPALIESVCIFSESMSSTAAGVEIRRLALMKTRKLAPFKGTKCVNLDEMDLKDSRPAKPEPALKPEVKFHDSKDGAGFFGWLWN